MLLRIAFLLTLVLPVVQSATKEWILNAIAPQTNVVSDKENLDWRLMSSQRITSGDCIHFIFKNPYFTDAPETYRSFDMSQPFSEPCDFSTSHKGLCTTVNSRTIQLQFTEDNNNNKITGSTVGKPFQNPYSSRSFQEVKTTYFAGCDLNSEPIVDGITTVAAFQQSVIRENEVTLTSSSQELAVTNSVLTFEFKPKSILPQQGRITVHVPSWYTISSQRLPHQLSSDSVLGFSSEGFFASHAGEGFVVIKSQFDASSRSMTIDYAGTRIISSSESVEFRITFFRNPVNMDTKKGFRITTQDSQGYLVDQSEDNLNLATKMTIPGRLVGKELLMLGDSEGQNIGRVFAYNKMSFFLSSYVPFEQFCYLKFVFPNKLKIDQNLQILTGEGIFAPSLTGQQLPTTSYELDLNQNIVYVEGCRVSDYLSSRPFGVINFSYVLLPDYVTDTDPIEVFAYSDDAYTDLVFEESKANGGGMSLTREQMQPGFLELVEFEPKNFYAFVEDVSYTVQIKPEHDMLPSTRIILTMPKTLKFDEDKGCTVTYTQANCKLDVDNHELILTDVFDTRTAGGTLLKFVISSADNPIGSQYAGQWGARTEFLYDGEYYIVDGNQEGYSFFALPGFIKSSLDYQGSTTYSDESVLDFTFETEHNVPPGGTLKVTLPVEMKFPQTVVDSQEPNIKVSQTVSVGSGATVNPELKFEIVTPEYINLSFIDGHRVENNPVRLTIENVRTPRSTRPSSEFLVQTLSKEGFIIDGGGTDINVVMTNVNTLKAMDVQALSQINGAITDYIIEIESDVELKDRDRILITTPKTVGFSTKGITCDAAVPPIGVSEISCESIDEYSLAVNFKKVDQNLGNFKFIVHGMKNPPNFRRSGLFTNIFMQTFDYYSIQKLENNENLWIQNNEPAEITDYSLVQSNELYGNDATYTVSFFPKNPISKDGTIVMKWQEPYIKLDRENFTCLVTTYQTFNSQCVIFPEDPNTIKIYDVFIDVETYFADISITIDKFRNPLTNKVFKPFEIETFDDNEFKVPVDSLEFVVHPQCTYPCMRCSADKKYCYSCWQDDGIVPYLMTQETGSTCKASCDNGWTTDGNEQKVCQPCDGSCKTCQDEAKEGDKNQCIECAEGFNLRIGKKCVERCPMGTYQSGTRCLECDSTCQTCDGSADQCTSCSAESQFYFLFENKCIAGCPAGMGNSAGVCFDCRFPCSECSTTPDICTACSQERGVSFLWGPKCIDKCPLGFEKNEVENKCEGCGSGCDECDAVDQRICLVCQDSMMMYESECVRDCPKGWLSNYSTSRCYPISGLDISLIPFPCIIIALTFLILSYAGSKNKTKHLLIPNWLVLMGLLEHGCILSQMILNFKYGTWRYGVFLMLAWFCYVAANIAFSFMHYFKIGKKDRLYNNWRTRPDNIWARRFMNIAGVIGSWKVYKLSYSGFWGVKLTPALFTQPETYRILQRRFLMLNILTVYVVIIVVCIYGLYDMDWMSTQLYIQMIENIVIFLFLIWAGLWEQRRQEIEYLSHHKYEALRGSGGKFNAMQALDDQDMAQFSKTRDNLLGAAEKDKMFIERKFEELTKLFGDRMCKSDYDLNRDDGRTYDPRVNKTWPTSPSEDVRGPVEPLPDPYPDNCFFVGYNEDQMFQMKFLSKPQPSQAIQADHYDADTNLRKDATLIVHQRDLADEEISPTKKKSRGRKNRFSKAIDHEDVEAAGLALAKGERELELDDTKKRNELIDGGAPLEAKRKKENQKLIRNETRQKAMMLTEENLRLKRLLEDQRLIDQKDQLEYQERILEEDSRRQEILANIEASRIEREARKNAIATGLNEEMDFRIQEIEKMKQEHLEKNPGLSDADRATAEAQFNAEKARLESEFNERLLKSQREAAPAASKVNSPAKFGSEKSFDQAQKAVRLEPQGVASSGVQPSDPHAAVNFEPTGSHSKDAPRSDAASFDEAKLLSDLDAVSAKKSNLGSSVHASPEPGTHRMSMMQTADEASGFDNSFVSANAFLGRRDFNEIDIVGTLDRDEKGNIIVPNDEDTGAKTSCDQAGRAINQYGYLVDLETGDILHNTTGATVFDRKDLDERGNIPMPQALEKFNFNPFDLQGTFFYDDPEDPLSFVRNQRGGRGVDELGRYVSLQGFLTDGDGSVLDRDGVKRFEAAQFKAFGGLMPKLFNYYGKTFELQEIMGVFDRDSAGSIQLLLGKDERGKEVYVDKAGFMVNQKGYIVTRDGHICTRDGKSLFLKAHLKNGEFPKIFPFTRFNINRILGDVEMDPGGQPILFKNENGQDVDKQERPVNAKGFLVDRHGNVIDTMGKPVFEKALLEQNGDVPEIFRSNILRSDSQSSLSRFMSEIDRDQRFDESAIMRNQQAQYGAASDTSFESMMEDSPSKYDRQNMRFSQSNPDNFGYGTGPAPKSARWAGNIPDNITEEISEYEAGKEPHRRKRKRVKGKGYVVEQVTRADVAMASAYGGVAKPRVRRTAPRFTNARTERSGLHTSQGTGRPQSNPRLQNLTGQANRALESNEPSVASQARRLAAPKQSITDAAGATTRGEATTQRTGDATDAGKTGFRGANTTTWRDQQMDPSIADQSAEDSEEAAMVKELREKRLTAQRKRKGPGKPPKPGNKMSPRGGPSPKYDRAFEEEFEKVYKKDIDKFIDGSDFEVESLAGFSEISKGTFVSAAQNNPRMKGLEKVYLQRLEFQQLGQKAKKYRPKPPAKREFMDRFNDDPRYIAKGERLKFEIGNTTITGSSGKKQSPRGNAYEMQPQRSQSSLLGQEALPSTGPFMRPAQTPQNLKLALQDSAASGQRQPSPRQPSPRNQ